MSKSSDDEEAATIQLPEDSDRIVRLSKLPEDLDADDLEGRMEKYGDVETVQKLEDNEANITFKSTESALKCVEALHKKTFPTFPNDKLRAVLQSVHLKAEDSDSSDEESSAKSEKSDKSEDDKSKSPTRPKEEETDDEQTHETQQTRTKQEPVDDDDDNTADPDDTSKTPRSAQSGDVRIIGSVREPSIASTLVKEETEPLPMRDATNFKPNVLSGGSKVPKSSLLRNQRLLEEHAALYQMKDEPKCKWHDKMPLEEQLKDFAKMKRCGLLNRYLVLGNVPKSDLECEVLRNKLDWEEAGRIKGTEIVSIELHSLGASHKDIAHITLRDVKAACILRSYILQEYPNWKVAHACPRKASRVLWFGSLPRDDQNEIPWYLERLQNLIAAYGTIRGALRYDRAAHCCYILMDRVSDAIHVRNCLYGFPLRDREHDMTGDLHLMNIDFADEDEESLPADYLMRNLSPSRRSVTYRRRGRNITRSLVRGHSPSRGYSLSPSRSRVPIRRRVARRRDGDTPGQTRVIKRKVIKKRPDSQSGDTTPAAKGKLVRRRVRVMREDSASQEPSTIGPTRRFLREDSESGAPSSTLLPRKRVIIQVDPVTKKRRRIVIPEGSSAPSSTLQSRGVSKRVVSSMEDSTSAPMPTKKKILIKKKVPGVKVSPKEKAKADALAAVRNEKKRNLAALKEALAKKKELLQRKAAVAKVGAVKKVKKEPVAAKPTPVVVLADTPSTFKPMVHNHPHRIMGSEHIVSLFKMSEFCCDSSIEFIFGNPEMKHQFSAGGIVRLDIDQRTKVENLASHKDKNKDKVAYWRICPATVEAEQRFDELFRYFVQRDRVGLVQTTTAHVYIVPPDPTYLSKLNLAEAGYAYAIQIPIRTKKGPRPAAALG